MQHIRVREGQTTLDIVMQYSGDAATVLRFCQLNVIGVTDDLIIASELLCDEAARDKKKYVDTFAKYGQTPASAITEAEELEGVGYWIIGQNFQVQ